jgi:hypothetical protein
MGKGWAKGLTAATDARVARNASLRRGRARGPYRNGGLLAGRNADYVWTPALAYAVGLIATDGNLSPDGRHISLASSDRDLLETFLLCLGRDAAISQVRGGYGTRGLRVQIGDVGLYRWLLSVGVTPRKSLTLGPVDVPDALFAHFARGLLDGDGSIMDIEYDGTGKARGRRYRTLLVRFVSASQPHVTWLRAKIAALFDLTGGLGCVNGLYSLTYAKRASLRLLPIMYSGDVPCLARKREVWRLFLRDDGVVRAPEVRMESHPPR